MPNTSCKFLTLSHDSPEELLQFYFERVVDFLITNVPATERAVQEGPPVDPSRVVATLLDGLIRQKRPWFLALDPKSPKEIIGILILGDLSLSWWAPLDVLTTTIIYVLPSHRAGGTVFDGLWNRAEEYAILEGKEFVPNLFMVDDLPRKYKLLCRRKGYQVAGMLFRKV